MENINLNNILNRNEIYKKIKEFLLNFKNNKKNDTTKRGIYIYGNPGIGKTTFIIDLLKDLNYDIIKYDAGDIRNKCVLETITKQNMSDQNVLSLLKKEKKELVILMDEIDGMNNGDKGGINTLIKLIRPKKTKKQKLEESTLNPIICIGNYHIDKKINELMKVCLSIELKTPTDKEIDTILKEMKPDLELNIKNNMIKKYIKGDLRKVKSILNIFDKFNSNVKEEMFENIFQSKIYNEDSKKITYNLLKNKYGINDHLLLLNETDRTIVSLLLHENIIDVLNKNKKLFHDHNKKYLSILDNICYADYIDRITFQKQIWSFNEMSSLIKTFFSNNLLHDNNVCIKSVSNDVRFTKILTKYSTEYNNLLFINNLCFQLSLDKKDLFSLFIYLKKNKTDEEIYDLFNQHNISKLDINRIFRYLDKYIEDNDSCDLEVVETKEQENDD